MTKDSLEEKGKNHEKNGCLGGNFGGSALTFLALTVGVLIWGLGILREGLPTWVAGGEKMVSAAFMKAEETLPGVKERVKQIAHPV